MIEEEAELGAQKEDEVIKRGEKEQKEEQSWREHEHFLELERSIYYVDV
jgi:hypothetical protein